ncbi:MAG: DUF192 domain-containing protein [bacterium]|nr:DUF192 domain-containing protein [bacterium]
MRNKGFSRNFWMLLMMAIILITALWSVGGSRIIDIAPYYFKYVMGDTTKVVINGQIFYVEIAETEAARIKGLSKRNYLEDGHGMLFIFEEEDYYSFTLKDTKLGLDIIWILDDQIVGMASRISPGTESITPLNKANYVLEVKSGNIAGGGWAVDDQVEITFDR